MEKQDKKREPTPKEVRETILQMPETIYIKTKKGTWPIKINGAKMRTLDQYLLLSASRISEAVTTQRPGEEKAGLLNTGLDLTLEYDDFDGEEAAIFNLRTLKRYDHVVRSVALPMNPEYEPWTKDIIKAWGNGNPWDISRHHAWAANRMRFRDMVYNVKSREGEKWKPLTNHGLRHIRIKELIQTYGFTPLEIQRFVGWTAGSLKSQGVNPMMDTYFSLVWRDYFPKLLKVKKT